MVGRSRYFSFDVGCVLGGRVIYRSGEINELGFLRSREDKEE